MWKTLANRDWAGLHHVSAKDYAQACLDDVYTLLAGSSLIEELWVSNTGDNSLIPRINVKYAGKGIPSTADTLKTALEYGVTSYTVFHYIPIKREKLLAMLIKEALSLLQEYTEVVSKGE